MTVEGLNNFSRDYTTAVGALVSRKVAPRAAVYVEPIFIANTNVFDIGEGRHTLLVGLGARVRVRPTLYVVGEVSPRLAGYDPGVSLAGFGVEKRVGGHSFQLNVSNGLSTTMGQVARGDFTGDDWFIGFNISRKFF